MSPPTPERNQAQCPSGMNDRPTAALPKACHRTSVRLSQSETAPDRLASPIMSSVLCDIGYQVQEAASGEAALDILKAHRPDLLVVDFGMPGANGAEVAATARQRVDGLRILIVSGYSDTSAIERAVGKTALLHKPFRPAEFAAAVRSLLDAPIQH